MNQSRRIIDSLTMMDDSIMERMVRECVDQVNWDVIMANEDLASVALAVKKMMAKFQVLKKVDWNKLMADQEENVPFKRALERVAKMVSKDFQVNTKGAEKFINQMVDMRISVLKI